MNWYFCFFAVYALLITPVYAQVDLSLGQEMKWRFSLQAAGIPLVRKQKQNVRTSEEEKRLLQRSFADVRLMRRLWHEGRGLLHCVHLKRLTMHVHLSFLDAGLTAVSYALLRTVLQTLASCGVRPERFGGRADADFSARGSRIDLQGIFVCRLGRLGAAAIRLGMAILRIRASLGAAEEEQHAAASD